MRYIQVLMIVFLIVNSNAAMGESLAVLAGRVDSSCVQPKSLGQLCRRETPPYVGMKIRYWQPVLLVETVKKPGDTAINEFSVLLGEPLKQAVAMLMNTNKESVDCGSASSFDSTATQMNDVHVFGFPFSNMFSSMIEPGCEGPPDLAGELSYLSEMDAVEWRTMKMESSNLMSQISSRMALPCDGVVSAISGLCLGSWGPLFPRGGWVAGYSAPVGSAVAAYRGVHIASLNMISFHVRLLPVLFFPDQVWDRIQMIYPVKSKCLRIGEDPRNWENGKVSQDGKYVWIYWRKKECCLF